MNLQLLTMAKTEGMKSMLSMELKIMKTVLGTFFINSHECRDLKLNYERIFPIF